MRLILMLAMGIIGGGITPPSGFLIVTTDDGLMEIDDAGLIYIQEGS